MDNTARIHAADRPLTGHTVLVTRSLRQSAALAGRLTALGASVVEAPTVIVEPPSDWATVDAALRRLADYDWLVLTSVNGVEAVVSRLAQLGLDAGALNAVRVATIGPATADELRKHGHEPAIVPDEYVAEALAETLRSFDLRGKRCLLLRSDLARQNLTEELRAAGAACDDWPIYRSICPVRLPVGVRERLAAGEIDWATFTSASTFTNLITLLGDDAVELLSRVKLASIGPITSRAIRAVGLSPTVEAAVYTVEGLVAAIVQSVATRG